MRNPPSAARVEAVERKLGSLSVMFLVILGLWLILAPWVGEYTGYVALRDLLGGEAATVRFFLGFLFLYFAGIVREKNELRHVLKGLMTIVRGGGGTPQEEQVRTAVDLLIQGLGSDRESTRQSAQDNLKRLTGQDHGDDRAAWEGWWAENRAGFRRSAGD